MGFTRSRSRLVISAIVLLLALGILLHRPILEFMGTIPISADDLEPAELVAVISGALPEIHYGLDLYRQGMGSRILFVGHIPVELAVISEEPFEVVERPWDEIAGRLAVGAGVPAENVLYSSAFTSSTYERVYALMETARENGHSSVIIVCDLVHSRRISFSARRIAEETGTRCLIAPTPAKYYLEPYRYDPKSWWRSEAFMTTVLGEYSKLLYYWIKYH